MHKIVAIALVCSLLCVGVFAAGCTMFTTQSSTPTPTQRALPVTPATTQAQVTTTPQSSDQSAYFESRLKSLGFAIQQPLTKSVNTYGSTVYKGTVARGQTSFSVTIELEKSIGETQQRTLDYKTYAINQGYRQTASEPDFWSGALVNANGVVVGEVEIIVDTNNLNIMIIEPIY